MVINKITFPGNKLPYFFHSTKLKKAEVFLAPPLGEKDFILHIGP